MEQGKVAAARGAYEIFREICRDGCVVGIGSGSTVKKFIEILSCNSPQVSRSFFYSSSLDTTYALSKRGIRTVEPFSLVDDQIDVYIDGADEVSENLDMIKGGGGALLREKVLASLSRYRIFIVDSTKLSPRLGSKTPVPVEVVPFSTPLVLRELKRLGYGYILRRGRGKLGPVVTDNGNFIVDVYTGPISDPVQVDRRLTTIVGVVATGIFPRDFVDVLVIGYEDGGYKVVFKR
ncbi:MAG: ribose 5-phosphate isomerase A [Thermoprotei archaeon]|nr:MAG: ribose 5-phosphate isomerase A [Thermoprotei archaeon]